MAVKILAGFSSFPTAMYTTIDATALSAGKLKARAALYHQRQLE